MIAKIKKEETELAKSTLRSVSNVPSFGKQQSHDVANVAKGRKGPTEVKEFLLRSVNRHELSAQGLAKSVEEQLNKEKEGHNFYAKPISKAVFTKPREVIKTSTPHETKARYLHTSFFIAQVPKSTRKPLTVLSPNLESDKRAPRRLSFDRKNKESQRKKGVSIYPQTTPREFLKHHHLLLKLHCRTRKGDDCREKCRGREPRYKYSTKNFSL